VLATLLVRTAVLAAAAGAFKRFSCWLWETLKHISKGNNGGTGSPSSGANISGLAVAVALVRSRC
jgi:hypothetical protein